jgi:DNA-binding NarL/FixJ family response regulator
MYEQGGTKVINKLTKCEQQTLALMAEGLSNKLIAARLYVSDHTTKFHVRNICKKLGAPNRAVAAAMWATEKAFAEGFENARRMYECPTCRDVTKLREAA